MRCSSALRKLSTCATSLTWMPAAPISVSEARRVAFRTARAAAIQPPSELPPGGAAAKPRRCRKAEKKVARTARGAGPRRRMGSAEAGMLGNEDVELFRQLSQAGEPDPHAAAAMKKKQRRPRPAAHEADAAVADRNGRN